ncbi:hypothetical protein A1Q1_02649 [Trichosporon asahii var. asahii CBS 2479]|uniref:Uncharacterized protein n=1 Tax=Trichosporon asahii var. asahii (strain ATCC 90039 / CBS 2479 / JCM 2466 / KCTC 7840 / NBRC 103889/ NCYC 2677 / UAMH 7654) TaxID=1186058 RepID=J5SZI6_TRIAS|nr:hypothetical protein A1Q1_02649 [Trichosporon asahii var. asahii CBS 2479]EJT48366.1 hypothetical protein A1Q1_02649 [Trichosporon asahii var. asahii CBS 2479]
MAVSPRASKGVASAAATIPVEGSSSAYAFSPPHAAQRQPDSASAVSSSYGSSLSLTEPRPSPWHAIADSLQTTPSLTPAPSALTSSALREWERQLAGADAVRHLLFPGRGSPKLSAERDRDGHVEYKLKLIDPEPERFDRLVTQMMWRLKQGRNEAIYELGLGDDGSVIGLTRPEMDASLSTLERMASEVGATVLVLKEIVLTEFSDSDSAASSVSGWSGSAGACSGSWKARRPDLDEFGRPRRGTKSLDASAPTKEKKKYAAGSYIGGNAGVKKSSDKRRRAAQRQERRRMELMRGDGMSPTPFDSFFDEGEQSPSPSGLSGSSPANGLNGGSGPSSRPGSTLSHRFDHLEPSSSGRSSVAAHLDDSPGEGTPDDTFVDGLRIPLDSLSLSFADVIEDQPSPRSPRSRSPAGFRLPASQTQEEGGDEGGDGAVEELVCVEALVVRKAGLEGEYFLPEDGWGFGE